MTVPLVPLTTVFFAGRLVSYSIYLSAATVAERNLGSLALDALTSPLGMALQIAMVVALALLAGGIKPRGARQNRLWPPCRPSMKRR